MALQELLSDENHLPTAAVGSTQVREWMGPESAWLKIAGLTDVHLLQTSRSSSRHCGRSSEGTCHMVRLPAVLKEEMRREERT